MKFRNFARLMCSLLCGSLIMSCSDAIEPEDNIVEEIENEEIKIDDALQEIQINKLQIKEIDPLNVDPKEIVVHCINVKEISNIEIEITTINDNLRYLAFQNFVEYYDIEGALLSTIKNLFIAGACAVVYVTLSTAAGPVGTFFGGILTSELSKSAILIGAALDATVSGYQAYKNGADFEEILGSMLIGVSEGIKFGALLAPVTGSFAGIKAIKSVKKLQSIPGMSLTYEQAQDLIKNYNKILKSTNGLTAKSSDDAIKTVFETTKSNLPASITADVFTQAVRNKHVIFDVITKFNPFDLSSETIRTVKANFIDGLGSSYKKGISSALKQIQNGKISSFDDVLDQNIKKYFLDNMTDMVELFGDKFNKQFLESTLKDRFSDDILDRMKNVISDNCYLKIAKDEQFHKQFSKALSNQTNLTLLQLKYGQKNLNKLLNSKTMFEQLLNGKKIDFKTIDNLMDAIYDGSVKSLDDIEKFGHQLNVNVQRTREVFVECLQNANISKKTKSLIDDITASVFKRAKNTTDLVSNAFSDDFLKSIDDIVINNLDKNDIITKYGQKIYNEFVDNTNYAIDALSLSKTKNTNLIKNIFADRLSNKGFNEEIVENIIKGTNIKDWHLNFEELKDIYGDALRYYKTQDLKTMSNFAEEMANIRGAKAKEFADLNGIDIRNNAYAGKIAPAPSKIIKEKYGDIRYSDAGFPIFDNYAEAVITTDLLTGVSDSDIRLVNILHHGSSETPKGFTWHHLEDGKSLILIPEDLHESYRHTGGASLILNGLNTK